MADLFTYTKEEIIEEFGLENTRLRGENLMSKCPNARNHDGGVDNHPSFGINLTTAEFQCFACGIKGLSLRSLARQLDMELSTDLLVKGFGIPIKKPKVYAPSYDATFPDNPRGAWDALKDRGVTLEAILKMKVTYDESKKYIIFPCYDQYYKLTGWEIRCEYWEGRYGCFPEGVDRTNLLFGRLLPETTIYLVEGPVDALKLISWGLNAVATCGNFIHEKQAATLMAVAKKIILVPDMDAGGRTWWKGAMKHLKTKVPLTYILTEGYKDVGQKEMTEEIFLSFEEKLV